MREPRWLDARMVMALHGLQIAKFGGSQGLRDAGLLDSAVARPKNLYLYQHADFPTMAAALAGGLISNHPFVDGNKRVAYSSAHAFLAINGFRFAPPEEQVYLNTLALAAGETSEEEFADWIASSLAPEKSETLADGKD